MAEVTDSRIGWVARHIRRYVATDGWVGGRWYGHDSLLLTTRGRRSGRPRRTALFYWRDGDEYVVVVSNGGVPRYPDWYLNLGADPDVAVQVGADLFAARARLATADERPRLWNLVIEASRRTPSTRRRRSASPWWCCAGPDARHLAQPFRSAANELEVGDEVRGLRVGPNASTTTSVDDDSSAILFAPPIRAEAR